MSGDPSDVLELLPEATLLADADGRVRRLNPAARRTLRLGEGDLLTEADPESARSALDRWSGSKRLLPATLLLPVAKTGALERMRCDGGVLRPRRGDEPALLLVRVRTRDEATSRFRELTERIGALTAEVVRRKAAEGRAEAQREWFEVTLSSIGDGVVATDDRGHVTFLNPAAVRYLGRPEAECLGRPLREVFSIVHEETRTTVEDPVKRVLRDGLVVGLANHTLLLRPDGSELAIADSAAPIRSAKGELLGVVLVFQDESARRFHQRAERALLAQQTEMRERAESAVRAKDDFIAAVSHELRTPLTAILGWADALRGPEGAGADVGKGVDAVARNALLLRGLVDDLLHLSNATIGRLALEMERADLAAIVALAVESVAAVSRARQIEVVVRGAAAPIAVHGDPAHLRQALWHLLANAVKFSDRGGVVEVDLAEGPPVRVTVRDRGVGLSAEGLERAFEPFWQAERRNTGPDRGLGLGLTVAQRIAQAHGGRLWVESEGPGRGAAFTLELPPPRDEGPAAVAGDAEEGHDDEGAVRGPVLEGLRVLVVEDEVDAREVLVLLLRRRGAEVRSAESAAVALSLLDRWVPDVLLSDIAMPVVDGYELARTLRARPPERGGDVAAVALTAFGTAPDVRRALDAGFDAHLAKPAPTALLVQTLLELARARSGGREGSSTSR